MNRSTLLQSFPCVASSAAKILILGSMPGERSLRQQKYYAHPQNVFWDIMKGLFGVGREMNYKKRLRILSQNRIALWDVVFQCRRRGSLDTNISMQSVVPNDFASLFFRCPQIDTVFFNGHKAEELFRKLVLKHLLKPLRLVRLPSTSPAHASLTKAQKMVRWHQELNAALKRSFHVYILQSKNGKYYTGYTTDLDRRMKQHRTGKGAKFIRGFGFGKLLYQEKYQTKSSALKREAEIKGWSRAQKEALIS